MNSNFSTKLKELRLETGLSQAQLAKKIDQAQSTYCYWETGKQEPTLSAIKKLCLFFDVTADYLIGLEDISQKEKNKIKFNIQGEIEK